jgi:hypothetical protein
MLSHPHITSKAMLGDTAGVHMSHSAMVMLSVGWVADHADGMTGVQDAIMLAHHAFPTHTTKPCQEQHQPQQVCTHACHPR